MNKFYKLRPSDFIPIIGGLNHSKRCFEKSSPLELTSNWYTSQCFARDFVLTLYNAAIFGGAIVGISGLAQLLSK